MSISDRLDQIEARLNYEGVMDEEADYRALCEDAPAMLAALRAVLDVCENYPIPPSDKDVTGEVLAGMEKLERLVRAAIHNPLGEA